MLGSLSCDTQFSDRTIVIVCIYKFLTDNGGTPPGESNTIFTARVDPVSAPSQRYMPLSPSF